MALTDKILAASKFMRLKRKGPQDLVAVDFDSDGTRCARVRFSNGEAVVVGLDVLPVVEIGGAAAERVFSLPKIMLARYVAVCVSGRNAVVKMLNLPGVAEGQLEEQIRDHMGVDDGYYRFGYRIISQNRSETRLLTVAIPEDEAHAACNVFPTGLPVPVSVELSGLAAMSAFMRGPGLTCEDEAVGAIDFGSRVTYFAFFKKKELMLIRKFDFGYLHLLDRIEQSMGVDQRTAQDIVLDRSFDISHLVKELAEPFIKQLVISRHFVERRENCRLTRLFACEDPMLSRDWLNEIKAAMGLEVSFWNPLEIVRVPASLMQKKIAVRPAVFAAAIGAILAAREERSADA